MGNNLEYKDPTPNKGHEWHALRLKSTCAITSVAARIPLGHVVFYAPASACELRLGLHHI